MHTTRSTSTSPARTPTGTARRARSRWSSASSKRLALVREFEQPGKLSVHHLLAELWDGVDWVLVEGFKSSNLLKIEVWRAQSGAQVRYPDDDFVVAIATDQAVLPQETLRPVLDLNQPEAVAAWLADNAERFDYRPECYT